MAWQYELERAKRDGLSLTSAQQNDVLKQRNESMRQKVKGYVNSKGGLFKSELEEWMRAQGFAKNVAQSIYNGMIKCGDLAKITENLTNRVFVGTPAVIAKILAESPPETYRLR